MWAKGTCREGAKSRRFLISCRNAGFVSPVEHIPAFPLHLITPRTRKSLLAQIRSSYIWTVVQVSMERTWKRCIYHTPTVRSAPPKFSVFCGK